MNTTLNRSTPQPSRKSGAATLEFSLNGENMYSGKRSPEAQKRREQSRMAKRIMIDYSFNDRFNGDVVNLLTAEQVTYVLSLSLNGEPVIMQAIPCCAEQGMILSDPYGRGSFQNE